MLAKCVFAFAAKHRFIKTTRLHTIQAFACSHMPTPSAQLYADVLSRLTAVIVGASIVLLSFITRGRASTKNYAQSCTLLIGTTSWTLINADAKSK